MANSFFLCDKCRRADTTWDDLRARAVIQCCMDINCDLCPAPETLPPCFLMALRAQLAAVHLAMR